MAMARAARSIASSKLAPLRAGYAYAEGGGGNSDANDDSDADADDSAPLSTLLLLPLLLL